MFHPQWLRTFSTLTELGSFTHTGDRLGMTQAAVSQHIKGLESRLGPLLLRQRARRIELTPTGQALLAYCRTIEQADKRLAMQLADQEAESGEISMISPGSVGLYLYPALLDLQAQNPALSIRYRFAPDRDVLESVLNNQYDLGLVPYRPDDARLSAEPFMKEALELIVPTGRTVESWRDLEQLGFIDHPDGRAMAARLLGKRYPNNPGLRTIPVRGFNNQISLILDPVARGFGFTVLPRYACDASEKRRAIRLVSGAPVIDTLWLIYRSEWKLATRVLTAIDYLRNLIERQSMKRDLED